MKFMLRCFSKMPVIQSPLGSYLEKSKDINFIAEIIKKHKEEVPKYKEQQMLLKDLELASILRLRDFTNERLISLAKAYSMMEQGSPHLYSTLVSQISKRIHSFSLTELSTLAYFLTDIAEAKPLFEAFHRIIMRSPLEIPQDIIGKISFSFSNVYMNSPDIYRVLVNIFCIDPKEISISNGFLFMIGLYRAKYVDPAVLPFIEQWADFHWNSFNGSELAQIVYIYEKFGLIGRNIKKIQDLPLEIMTASDIEKVIGCFLEKELEVPERFLEQLFVMIKELKITPIEVIYLVYTLSLLPKTEKHFEAMNSLLEKTFHLIPTQEKIVIFIALLRNHKETLKILELFSNEQGSSYKAAEIIYLLPALQFRNNLFLPYTEVFLSALHNQLQGKVLSTQDLILAMYILCKLKYDNMEFWESALSASSLSKLNSAEEYIQLKKTIKELSKIGVDTSNTLAYLESKYEFS